MVLDSENIFSLLFRNLADLMDQFVKDFHKQCVSESSSRDEPISSLVLPSSADLFVFYKKCLVQCISLSTGEALLQLTQLFQKYLEKFADRVLAANIPKYVIFIFTSNCSVLMSSHNWEELP